MNAAPFELEIFAPGRADIFLACAEDEIPWGLVERLDRANLRVVGDPAGPTADASTSDRVDGCAGAVGAVELTTAWRRPFLHPSGASAADVEAFVAAVLHATGPRRRYAFMVGRLERDFRQAREAMRVAVEREAGLPLLWSDDGRHRTNVDSVRERTRLLIKHAAFVIADLTLGVESPDRENPSRAHEIGLAVAYGRPLMLCSQEPRRDPYFSVGDMQMSFWPTERDLEHDVAAWIRAHGKALTQRVFNYELSSPKIAAPAFVYEPATRFIGPNFRPAGLRRLLMRLT